MSEWTYPKADQSEMQLTLQGASSPIGRIRCVLRHLIAPPAHAWRRGWAGGWCVIPNLSVDGAAVGVSVNVWNAKCQFWKRVITTNGYHFLRACLTTFSMPEPTAKPITPKIIAGRNM